MNRPRWTDMKRPRQISLNGGKGLNYAQYKNITFEIKDKYSG